MSVTTAKWLLVLVMLTRGSAFIFSKIALAELAPFPLIAWRFGLACIVLALIFRRHIMDAIRREPALIRSSGILGLLLFLIMGGELVSLRVTPVHTVSFLEHLAIAIIPILSIIIYRRLPPMRIALGAAVIIAGVALLTLKEGLAIAFTIGELYVIGVAFVYAIFILTTERLAAHSDALALGILQMGALAILAAIATPFVDAPAGMSLLPTEPATLYSLAYLIVVASGIGFTLQPMIQRYVTSEETGMFCALNPLFASLLGMLVFGETLGATASLGALLILGGIVYVNLPAKAK